VKRLYALIAAAALCFPSIGAWAWWQSIQQVAISAGGGGCSQATAFLARNGNANSAATTTFICGLVTDGIITGTMAGSGVGATGCGSKIDALYLYSTDTSAHALLNLCSTSFTAALLATNPTFTASQGFTGNASGAIDTTFILGVGAYTLNVATAAVCVLNNRTTANTNIEFGTDDAGTTFLTFRPLMGSNTYEVSINDNSFLNSATTTSQGSWLVNRTSSSSVSTYRNGSLLATQASAVGAMSAVSVYVLAYNNNGAIASPSSDQIGAFMLGALSNADGVLYAARLSTYMTALGNSGC